MVSRLKPVQITPGELEEKLNHLEYVVENTKKAINTFKCDSLKEQTKDLIELMETFKDAIATYRDEVADQVDVE